MLAAEVAQFLANQGIGTFSATTGGNIFVDAMPPTPDTAISVMTTGGSRGDGTQRRFVTLQVIVRGTQDPRVAHALAMQVYNALAYHHAGPLIAGGTQITLVVPVQTEPVRMGQDENRRHEYSLNFDLEVPYTHWN